MLDVSPLQMVKVCLLNEFHLIPKKQKKQVMLSMLED